MYDLREVHCDGKYAWGKKSRESQAWTNKMSLVYGRERKMDGSEFKHGEKRSKVVQNHVENVGEN